MPDVPHVCGRPVWPKCQGLLPLWEWNTLQSGAGLDKAGELTGRTEKKEQGTGKDLRKADSGQYESVAMPAVPQETLACGMWHQVDCAEESVQLLSQVDTIIMHHFHTAAS